MIQPIEVAVIAGARPNFVKIAPIMRCLDAVADLNTTLFHTGQHYDKNLSTVFFDELQIREPDITLVCEGRTHGEQTASMLRELEAALMKGPPSGGSFDVVVVVGDVNSTLAAALAAAKLGIAVAHVEAGLRSFDRTMPEEINRLATDSISDLLLASEPSGVENLRREGHSECCVRLVGNVMIDTLFQNLEAAKSLAILEQFSLVPNDYAVVTMHRPSNVDDAVVLGGLLETLVEVSSSLPVVFPLHPRTRSRLESYGLFGRLASISSIRLCDPIGYLPMLCLTSQAKVVITDSGGLQEETTAMKIPCLTLRENTERPVTVSEGTSTLIGNDRRKLRDNLQAVLTGTYKQGRCPALWDGWAAQRIVGALRDLVALRRGSK